MAEFVVVERNNPTLGLTHGVYRKGEPSGMPMCLCYDEAQATLVAAALAAYAPVGVTEPVRLPEPVERAEGQAPELKAKKPQATKAKKPTPKRKGRKPA